MAHKSGSKVDKLPCGDFELIYFGIFSASIPSQSIVVRNRDDLEDIRDHIDKFLEGGDDSESLVQ